MTMSCQEIKLAWYVSIQSNLRKKKHKESLSMPFIELEAGIQQSVWIPQVTYCCRHGVMRVDQDNDVLTLWCLGVVFCFMVTIFMTRSTSEHHRLGNLINSSLSSLQIRKNEIAGKGHVKRYLSCPVGSRRISKVEAQQYYTSTVTNWW